ncbi:malectin domain-containing carbohydrate-binding protein, partial [Pontibacter vulgaris]|uniref:malectin domain-containing carbohydrate-binding protein n=1 Tax=Pontibacter vulgaris TaxID=2905679 RepID=UPI001FA802B3
NGTSAVTYTFDDFSVEGATTPPPAENQPPVFVSGSYSFSVSDGSSVGTSIGSVKANDPNGDNVTYTITAGNTNKAFAINAVTGVLTVAKKLNFHTQTSYTLTVRATDAAGLFGQSTAGISIILGETVPAFSTINWGTAASQPYTVSEAQGEVVSGKLYTFGGFDSQKSGYTPTSRAFVYDPGLNKWISIAPMPPMNGTNYGGVTHAGFATDGTDIYFAGGYTSNSTGTGQIFGTKEVWKYIVSENRYARLPDLPIVIAAGQLEYLNGKLHHIAGTNQARTLDLGNHYVLDLDNLGAGWKTLAALPNPRQHAGSAVFEGKIYFIGGQTGHDSNLVTSKEVHRYDIITNSWTKMADLPVPSGANGRGHITSSVIVAGNRIIVLGGETAHGSRTNMVSAYTPSLNSWQNLTGLPASRYSGVAALLYNNIYYTGGSSSSITYKGVPSISSTQKLVNFTLINADTKQDIQTINSGSTINLATLPTRNLNIRANSSPTTVGSIVFALTGAESKNAIDNSSPYFLMGDNGSWTPKVGTYTLKGTPYTGADGAGTAGTSLTINFIVTDESSPSSGKLLNAGGGQFTDGQGRSWSADAYFSSGTTAVKSFDVAGTTDDGLYLSYRYAVSSSSSTPGAPFSYSIPLSSGTYSVKLHFTEPYFKAANARVFNVDAEGQRVLSNYDIYAQVGYGRATVKTFTNVAVTDGTLNLAFSSVKNNAIISAIEVVQETAATNASAGQIVTIEGLQEPKMQVYPNPNKGEKLFVMFEGLDLKEKVSITIYDMAGRIIQKEEFKPIENGPYKREVVLQQTMRSGLYIIKAHTARGVVETKLVLD